MYGAGLINVPYHTFLLTREPERRIVVRSTRGRSAQATTIREEQPVQLTDVTIQGKSFKAQLPYAEGHVLTATEAAVLNQTRVENLRNNFASFMKRAAEDKESPRELGQDEFDKYQAEYKFGVRQGGTRVAVDPVTREARAMASKAIKDALKKKNVDLKSLPEGKFDELVDGLLEKRPEFRQQAETIVNARKSAVSIDNLDV